MTTLDVKKWDVMISRASTSGLGMIRAVANFCNGIHCETKEDIKVSMNCDGKYA